VSGVEWEGGYIVMEVEETPEWRQNFQHWSFQGVGALEVEEEEVKTDGG
jgi:hypothetical protein